MKRTDVSEDTSVGVRSYCKLPGKYKWSSALAVSVKAPGKEQKKNVGYSSSRLKAHPG